MSKPLIIPAAPSSHDAAPELGVPPVDSLTSSRPPPGAARPSIEVEWSGDDQPVSLPPEALAALAGAATVAPGLVEEAAAVERADAASPAHDGVAGDDDPERPLRDARACLRAWTDELDAERAMALWIGAAAAPDVPARESALARWVEWAGVALPGGVGLADLLAAQSELLAELDAIAREPERVERAEPAARPALARALRAWIRTREDTPAAVLGGVHAVLRAEALGGVAPAPASERVILANVLRRAIERLSAPDAVPMLRALVQLDAPAEVLPPFVEATLDFLLFDAEARSGYAPELASVAHVAAWDNTIRLGLQRVGRSAVRAARLLAALAAHPPVARALPAPVAEAAVQNLVRALGHPRAAVWSRAARAMGRLAGVLPGLLPEVDALLDPRTPLALRRRAHAVLGALSPAAPRELHEKRDALLAGPVEPWLIAAFALGLPDAFETHEPADAAPVDAPDALIADAIASAATLATAWTDAARTYAMRGGPESWPTLLFALRDLAVRRPALAPAARSVAAEVRALAEAHKGGSPGDTEQVERTLALSARLLAADDGGDAAREGGGNADTTPWGLVHALARRVAVDPYDPAIGDATEDLVTHTEQAVASALKAVSQDSPRVAARAGLVLEEVVDLLVDGDLAVVAERIGDGAMRAAAVTYAEALRKRMLRAVWTGLRRPTPSTPAWRRWLLRTATTLSRVEPTDAEGADREGAVRAQVLDTLARIADDPSIQVPALQRFVVAAVVELSDVLRASLRDDAALAVLVWMALRNAALPIPARTRRALEQIPAEKVDRLFFLVEQLGRPGRATDAEVAELGALAGDRCRTGLLLRALAREVALLTGRRPEPHWSGLPRLDLTDLARVADDLKRARDDASYALTLDPVRESSGAGETLVERAARLNRALTSTSLKFVDAARRAEIVEQYVGDLSALCEAIASACGPVAGTPVRAALAKALVAVRTLAADVTSARAEDVRYIARLKVLGALASAAEGGMTSTYLAEGPAPGKRVVVKLLPWERFAGASADAARVLFEREMQRLAPLVHPNVVSIVDAGFVEEGAYIAIEHIPGASLETLLRTVGPLDLRRLGPIVRDVARGLAYLHARGVVHRDIKPGNILVQLEGLEPGAQITPESWARAQFVRAVVIDLGIATDDAAGGAANAGASAGGPDDGGLVGTPGYLAPEIARGLDLVTPAIDVYALAVVVFEILTGSNPFLEGEPELPALLVRHGTMLLPLEELPEDAQRPALLHLLAESGKLDPRTRPTMREFLTRWTAALR